MTATGNEAVTLAQLRTATGSTGGGGATGGEAVTIAQAAQAHASQADWTPEAAASLWSRIDIAADGIDVWTQPTGAHNAYNTGDRVHYPAKESPLYVSTIAGNVWAPDAYPQGWQLEEAK